MSSVTLFSWLTPSNSEETIATDPWLRITNPSHPELLPATLSDWDSATDLTLGRSITLNAEKIRRQCEIDGPMRIVATWWSHGTQLGKTFAVEEIDSTAEVVSIELQGVIPGTFISEKIVLRTVLVTTSLTRALSPLSPSHPGSIIWEDNRDLGLEGTASRFPTEIVSFSEMGLHSEAGWKLVLDSSDLNLPFRQGVMLYINSENASVYAAVAAPARSAENRAIIGTIRFDVARTLLSQALSNEEFQDESTEYDSESIGEAARRMMAGYFSGEPVSSVEEMMRERPEEFSTFLQSGIKLFRNVYQ